MARAIAPQHAYTTRFAEKPPRSRVMSAAPARERGRGAAGFVRWFMVLALVAAVLAVLFFVARGFALYSEALAATSLDDMAAAIEGAEGFTPIDELPDLYLQAVVSVEDHRFYAHPGVDVIACARALIHDVQAGAIVEGGSTITQQLAKNQYFTQEQTVERKIAETFMALTIEQHFSKRDILELYVNSIYFGDGLYGVGQASSGYFSKSASQMDPCEATLLAGIPNAPSAYAPTANAELARERQQQVIDRLVACDYLEESEARRIVGTCSV